MIKTMYPQNKKNNISRHSLSHKQHISKNSQNMHKKPISKKTTENKVTKNNNDKT